MREIQREEINPGRDSITTVRRKARLALALDAMERAQAKLAKAHTIQAQRVALEELRRAKLQAQGARPKRNRKRRKGFLSLLA